MAMSSTLTGEGLSAVLAVLDRDPVRAAAHYETMRMRLIRFFVWQGVLLAEDCADQTIDRVARRLAAGERIQASEPARYFHGVARNVLREHRAQMAREIRNRALWPQDGLAPPPGASESASADCLHRCLGELPAATRELVLEYYQGSGAARIAHRQAMAARLGLALPALRVRMHRLRARLEACAGRCLGDRPETFVPSRPPVDEE
jgi:DNA-directed RNA polymerase specialized sigma24 family protein